MQHKKKNSISCDNDEEFPTNNFDRQQQQQQQQQQQTKNPFEQTAASCGRGTFVSDNLCCGHDVSLYESFINYGATVSFDENDNNDEEDADAAAAEDDDELVLSSVYTKPYDELDDREVSLIDRWIDSAMVLTLWSRFDEGTSILLSQTEQNVVQNMQMISSEMKQDIEAIIITATTTTATKTAPAEWIPYTTTSSQSPHAVQKRATKKRVVTPPPPPDPTTTTTSPTRVQKDSITKMETKAVELSRSIVSWVSMASEHLIGIADAVAEEDPLQVGDFAQQLQQQQVLQDEIDDVATELSRSMMGSWFSTTTELVDQDKMAARTNVELQLEKMSPPPPPISTRQVVTAVSPAATATTTVNEQEKQREFVRSMNMSPCSILTDYHPDNPVEEAQFEVACGTVVVAGPRKLIEI